MLLYNFGTKLIQQSYRLIWRWKLMQRFLNRHAPKAYKHIMGQQGLLDTIHKAMNGNNKDVYWFHAASYGEYNVVRPVIRHIQRDEICIVVTFFSPTGYEMLSEQNLHTHEIDYVFYLPLDTHTNARRFLEILKPKKAIFAISEYWMNHLYELGAKHIPTYMVSMLVGEDSYLLKWYGFPIRKALKTIRVFMVLDEQSKRNLNKIGFANVVATGDPLFDNAIAVSKTPYYDTIIENFCTNRHNVFVAGSISDKRDIALVSALANANRDVKFIVVPHEIREDCLNEIIYQIEGKVLLYSECDDITDFNDTQVLIIDFLGSLAYIYRYGSWAYVGGGFTPYLHSVIEPVVYGIPVAFGPRIERKRTPKQMINLGVGFMVKSKESVTKWFEAIKDKDELENLKKKALEYVKNNSNVTNKIIDVISK